MAAGTISTTTVVNKTYNNNANNITTNPTASQPPRQPSSSAKPGSQRAIPPKSQSLEVWNFSGESTSRIYETLNQRAEFHKTTANQRIVFVKKVFGWLAVHDKEYLVNHKIEDLVAAISDILNMITSLIELHRAPSFVLYLIIYASDRFVERTGINHHQIFNLLLTSSIVNLKFWNESIYIQNKTIADIFSFNVKDLNTMERRFLFGLDYNLCVTEEQLNRYIEAMRNQSLSNLTIPVVATYDLVKEYLVFRGFTQTNHHFTLEKKADKLKGFQVDKILEQINYYVSTYDILHLVELWNFLDSTFFNRIDYNTHYGFKSSTTSTRQDFSATIKKLANSLKKFYLITAINNGKIDKVRDFFDIYSQELVKDPEWKHWFALPHLKTPHSDPLFEIYFSKGWSEAFSLSLRNFLSTIFKNIQTQVENLINQNEELRSQVDKLEYQSKRDQITKEKIEKELAEKETLNQFSRGNRSASKDSQHQKQQQQQQDSDNGGGGSGSGGTTSPVFEDKEKVVIGSVRSRKSMQVQSISSSGGGFEMTEMDEMGSKKYSGANKQPTTNESTYSIESQEVCTSHTTAVTRCKFSSNGSKIASSSVDGTVRLLCGTTDSKIKLWNSTTDKAIGDINTSTEFPRVEDLVCNPNGNSFASSSTNMTRTDGIVYTWNFRTLKTEERLSSSNAIINSMCYNNNGTLLATGCVDGTVRIFAIQWHRFMDTLGLSLQLIGIHF
eukprot:gene13311-15648_t